MKILHVNTEAGFRGGERQVLLLARGLRERGHEQVVFCREAEELQRRLEADGLETATGSLKRAAARFRPDIVHAHTARGHSLAMALRRRVPIVVTRRVDFPVKRNPLSRRKYQAAGLHFIAISSGVRDALVKGGVPRERIDIVHSGIDTARVQGGDGAQLRREWLDDGEGPLIGFVGALADHKAPWVLAEAAVKVRKELIGARAVFVGEGEERERVEAAAAHDPKAIHVAGWRDDIADCYAAFDLFVMPSKLEGLCTSLIDALASGVPAIAARAGGIPDVIADGETGELVEPLNAEALAKAIVGLWKNERRRRLYIEHGLKRVEEKFTAEAMVRGTEAVYTHTHQEWHGRLGHV